MESRHDLFLHVDILQFNDIWNRSEQRFKALEHDFLRITPSDAILTISTSFAALLRFVLRTFKVQSRVKSKLCSTCDI